MKNIAFYLLLGLSLIGLAACNDDDSAFAGGDNYITRFEISNGDEVYVARITSDNRIELTIPENVALDEAVAAMSVSENATIKPAPAEVADWTQDMIFRVVAYNGAEREYRYSLTRSEVPEKGSVRLSTQAEVDAFAASGVRTIEGSLFIGTDREVEAADSITSLRALAAVERIGGNLVVEPTFAASEFNMAGLKSVGGNFTVQLPQVKTLRMPSLETVYGSLNYEAECDSNLKFDTHTVDLPKLREVGQNLTLDIVRYYNTVTEDSHISLPVLEKVGGTLTMGRSINTALVRFPALKQIGTLDWQGNMGSAVGETVYTIAFDALERVNGDFVIADIDGVYEVLAPELTSIAGKFYIKVPNARTLEQADFGSLTSIGGDFELGGMMLDDMSAFRSLESIGGKFAYSAGRGSLTSLDGLEALKTVGGGNISIISSELTDVGGLCGIESPISQLLLSTTSSVVTNIESLKYIDFGALYLGQPSGDTVYDLRGFKFETLTIQADVNGKPEVTSQYMLDDEVTANIQLKGVVTIKGLKRLNGELNCGKRDNDMYQVKYCDLPDLEEVNGDLYYVYAYLHNFPKLKSINGNLTTYMNLGMASATPFPSLERIGGYADLQINVGGLDFPALKTVGGELKIMQALSWSKNLIETMDGFSSLESAGRLNIQYCAELYSYEGLAKAIAAMTDKSQWEVSHNKYNPSYEDVKAGKLVMDATE